MTNAALRGKPDAGNPAATPRRGSLLYKGLYFAVRTCAAFAAAAVAACGAGEAQMLTPWGEGVTSENCWRSYPRPQMVREGWTNLNGDWDYAVTSVTNTPGRPEKWDGKIRVPFCIESALSGVGRLLEPDEFLWYTRKIVCDPKPGERTLLHFGGVDFRTMVFIGHDEVTDVPHEGGQNPFTLDITDYVKKGENELTVCVWDPTEDFVNSRGKQSFAPKGCFYTRVSGIWQTVWMETVPEKHIKSYKVTTDIDKGEVTIEFRVESGKCRVGESSFAEAAEDKCGTVEIETSALSAPLREKFTPNEPVTVKLPAPVELWSPENPKLYNFTAKYGKDVVKGYFGMRKIEKRKDGKGALRFFLNNRPYFMLGTLDQGWWPDGLLTPPSEEAMEYDVKVLKDCGFNMLRKHIKVEPQQYYAMCDRLGILVIQDLPSGSGTQYNPMKAETVKRYWLERQEMKEMMDDLQPFPSIVMWNPYNEGWSQPGEFLTHFMLDFTRRYDKTRLVNGPSGSWDWEGGHLLPKGWAWTNRVETVHKPAGVCEAADTVDMHLYRGPTMFAVNDRRISFLGEFGGLGHPVAGHLWKESKDGKGNWGYGGIEDTKTPEGLEKAYLGLMEKLGELAEKGLGGSVYTQTTDVEIEINGLLTYDRKVLKFNPKVLKKAHEAVIKRVARPVTPEALATLRHSLIHRGDGKGRPDNTMEAMLYTWGKGYSPECDIRYTKDGKVVAFHDPKLKGRNIGDWTWDELREEDVGSYRGEQYATCRAPLWETIFTAMEENPSRKIHIDWKDVPPEKVAEMVKAHGLEKQCWFITKDYGLIKRYKAALPGGQALHWMNLGNWGRIDFDKPGETDKCEAHLMGLFEKAAAENFKDIDNVQLHCQVRCGEDGSMTFCPRPETMKRCVERLHAAEVEASVFVWHEEANRPEVYLSLWELGFDSFGTDYPESLYKAVDTLRGRVESK